LGKIRRAEEKVGFLKERKKQRKKERKKERRKKK
jgi:hypothetical protein